MRSRPAPKELKTCRNTTEALLYRRLSPVFFFFFQVPSKFMLCNGRSWLVPIFSVGPAVRMACALPAMLLTVRGRQRRPAGGDVIRMIRTAAFRFCAHVFGVQMKTGGVFSLSSSFVFFRVIPSDIVVHFFHPHGAVSIFPRPEYARPEW